MLDNIASRSFCWRSTVWMRSSNCSAMRFIASATAADFQRNRRRAAGGRGRRAANRSAPALISSNGRLMRREITRLIDRVEKRSRSRPPPRSDCGPGQRARSSAVTRQRRPHHGRRLPAVHQRNGRVDPLFLLGGTVAGRVSRARRRAPRGFPAGRRGCPCRAGLRRNRRSPCPRAGTTVIRVLVDWPNSLQSAVDSARAWPLVKQFVDRFGGQPCAGLRDRP